MKIEKDYKVTITLTDAEWRGLVAYALHLYQAPPPWAFLASGAKDGYDFLLDIARGDNK